MGWMLNRFVFVFFLFLYNYVNHFSHFSGLDGCFEWGREAEVSNGQIILP